MGMDFPARSDRFGGVKLPKFSPQQMIDELRFLARSLHEDIDESVIPLEEMTEWEAADLIQKFHGALQKISDGAPDPKTIATDALRDDRDTKSRPRDLPFRIEPSR